MSFTSKININKDCAGFDKLVEKYEFATTLSYDEKIKTFRHFRHYDLSEYKNTTIKTYKDIIKMCAKFETLNKFEDNRSTNYKNAVNERSSEPLIYYIKIEQLLSNIKVYKRTNVTYDIDMPFINATLEELEYMTYLCIKNFAEKSLELLK